MTAPLVLAAIGLALVRRRPARWRRPSMPRLGSQLLKRAAASGLALAVALVVGGLIGVALGAAVGIAVNRLIPRLESSAARRRRHDRAAELPLILDLLGVCLRAGMPLVAALETVATALPGPFSDDLHVVAGLLRLGAAPAAAWTDQKSDADLAAVGRVVARSADSGSRLAGAFDRLAADRRSALASAGLSRARSAGVIAMAPLGLCFLPAFICLGIVPIVLSLFGQVLPS